MFLNINCWEKLTFSKLVGKVKFLERNLKKCTDFEEQKCTSCIQENVYFGIIIFSCLSSTKLCLRFLLNCFEMKGFYQSSLGNEVDFREDLSNRIYPKQDLFQVSVANFRSKIFYLIINIPAVISAITNT